MIAHENAGMDAPPEALAGLCRRLQKTPPVRVVLEERLAPIASIEYTINRPRNFLLRVASHVPVS